MKTPTIYATEKKMFIFAADSEQRGLNATLKAIHATKGAREANNTLAADALTWDIFKTASNYVAYSLTEQTPSPHDLSVMISPVTFGNGF